MILAVGYRVKSPRGTQFRQWATARLSEYLVKGFTMDDERLKNPPGPGVPDYFFQGRLRPFAAQPVLAPGIYAGVTGRLHPPTICNFQSAIFNFQFTITNLQSPPLQSQLPNTKSLPPSPTICNLQLPICNLFPSALVHLPPGDTVGKLGTNLFEIHEIDSPHSMHSECRRHASSSPMKKACPTKVGQAHSWRLRQAARKGQSSRTSTILSSVKCFSSVPV